MSALPVETMEPHPAATSLPNEDTVKTEGSDKSAPTDTAAEIATNGANGSTETEAEVKGETMEEAPKENGGSAEKKNEESSHKNPRQRTYDDGVLKTSAQQIDGKNNSKYDPSVLPVSGDHKQIRSQVEFYFGDTNLPSDNHMWKLTGGAENLPVSIKDICSFGRMRRFQPHSAVVAALKASKFLEVIGEEGEEQVKRRYAFDPTIPKSKVEGRSVYVKGFGDEEPSSQFDIEAFFAPYGPTNEVRLRRTDNKLFKGSVFVEFEDEELAKKFLELDPKPLWKGVHTLKVSSKTQYIETKAQEIRDGKVEPKVHRGRGGHRGNNRGRGDFRGRGDRKDNDRGGRDSRGDRDPDDWKKRREDDRASGFKDNRRNDRGDRRGNNRGGRGGGRRDRDDRGPRNNDRNRERDEKNKDSKTDDKDGEKEKPEVKAEVKVESPKDEKKRAREDDDIEHAPAKKVDTKSEVAATS